MSLRLVQLMAVGTVGCGVVDLCGSNAFPVLELIFTFLVLVGCKNKNDHYTELWYCASMQGCILDAFLIMA